jgi:CHAD domain-containing protein
MNHQLKPDEKLSDGIRRIARKEAFAIRKQIRKKQFYSRSISVHQVRIGVKKMRALLRLIRRQLGERLYHKQNDAWRSVGNSLAPLRNMQVQLKTLDKVCGSALWQISDEEFASLHEVLSKEREAHFDLVEVSKKPLKLKLHAALRGMNGWPLKGLKNRDLRSGLKKSHHRFLKAYERARAAPTNGNLHEWRKRTKDLLYQLNMMKLLVRKSVEKLFGSLEQIGKDLGDHHDLALLERMIAKCDPPVSKQLRSSIRQRRVELQQSAFKLSRELSLNDPFPFDRWIKH